MGGLTNEWISINGSEDGLFIGRKDDWNRNILRNLVLENKFIHFFVLARGGNRTRTSSTRGIPGLLKINYSV